MLNTLQIVVIAKKNILWIRIPWVEDHLQPIYKWNGHRYGYSQLQPSPVSDEIGQKGKQKQCWAVYHVDDSARYFPLWNSYQFDTYNKHCKQ